MSYTQKIFLIIGSTFTAIGILIFSVFLMILNVAPDGFASFLALPIFLAFWVSYLSQGHWYHIINPNKQ